MDSTAPAMQDRSKEFVEVLSLWGLGKPTPAAPATTGTDDSEDRRYFEIGLEKDTELRARWDGKRPKGNESEDDQGFINKLAFWCNNNAALIKEMYYQSPYYGQKDTFHAKKSDRDKYIDRTIKTAIDGTPVTAKEKDAGYRQEQARRDFTPSRPPATEQIHEVKRTTDGYAPATDIKQGKTMLVRISDVTPKDVTWLWEPYIPRGKITIIRGDPGEGKTTISLTLASIVTNGLPFPTDGRFTATEPGNVLFLTVEDDLDDTIAPRLIKAKADTSKVFAFDETSMTQLTIMSPEFEELFKESTPALVIIDPLQGFLGADVDGHRANEVRPVMSRLCSLASRFNSAVVILEHLNKNIGGKGLYRGLGSIDITAAARSILMAGHDLENENNKGLAHVKSNLAKLGKVIGYSLSDNGVEWNLNTTLTAEQIQGQTIVREERTDGALREAKEFLQNVLKNGKQTSKDVALTAKQCGIKEMTLRRAREELGIDTSEREGFGKDTVVYWKLPYTINIKPLPVEQSDDDVMPLFHSDVQNPIDTTEMNTTGRSQ